MNGFRFLALFAMGALTALSPVRAQAQNTDNGSVEFSVRATPSAGLEEPVRGFPFFLLSKSFRDITKEVEAAYPAPDMNAFVDKLEISKELKAWMKKNHWVQLSGEDFIDKLKPPDVMGVPEFYEAYVTRMSGDGTVDFPKPKYKPADRTKDPAKYEKLKAEYTEAVRRFLEQAPDTVEGLDLELDKVDPSAKWNAIEAKRPPEIRRRVLELAQSKYFVASTQTNLDGEGYISRIPPGNYWLSTLDVAADVGDMRPRWDLSLPVHAGEQTRVALSNANALPPSVSTP
jgi:hypothetical protein